MISMTQYLAEAEERDKAHALELKQKEEAEDLYYDELSDAIDDYPIGRFTRNYD